MPRALVKVQLTKTPISERPVGLRLRAAMWNPPRGIFGPSFDRPWSIAEWSDHSVMEAAHVFKMERFLVHRGYTVERYGPLITAVVAQGSMHYLDAGKDDEKVNTALDRVESSVEQLTDEEKMALVRMLTGA